MDRVILAQSHLTEKDFEALKELADRSLGERCLYGNLNLENHLFSCMTDSTAGVSTHNYPVITQGEQSYIRLADGRIDFHKRGFNVYGLSGDSEMVMIWGANVEVDGDVLGTLESSEMEEIPSLYRISKRGPVLLHLGDRAVVFNVGDDPDKMVHEALISHGYSDPIEIIERGDYTDAEQSFPNELRAEADKHIPGGSTALYFTGPCPEDSPEGDPDAYIAPPLPDEDAGTDEPISAGTTTSEDDIPPPERGGTGAGPNRRSRPRINMFPFNERLSAYLPDLAQSLGTSRR
ncbi:MAG: hypothetical protein ACXABY_19655, partial [Candidatus Thorarchaeota archaeon]